MANKAQEVFDIPELLEAILLYSSIIDVLFTQAVSTSFNQTINSSSQLRRLLSTNRVPSLSATRKRHPTSTR